MEKDKVWLCSDLLRIKPPNNVSLKDNNRVE